jgi:hypothetical protein
VSDFVYTGSGTIQTFGCALWGIDYFFQYRFGVNTAAYDVFSAMKGRLEEVWIREVFFRHGAVVYKDTLNAIYGEVNLCTQAEAIAYATEYYQDKIERIEGRLNNCQTILEPRWSPTGSPR